MVFIPLLNHKKCFWSASSCMSHHSCCLTNSQLQLIQFLIQHLAKQSLLKKSSNLVHCFALMLWFSQNENIGSYQRKLQLWRCIFRRFYIVIGPGTWSLLMIIMFCSCFSGISLPGHQFCFHCKTTVLHCQYPCDILYALQLLQTE